MALEVKFSQNVWQEKFLHSLDIQPNDEENKENMASPKTHFTSSDFAFPLKGLDAHLLQNSFQERLFKQTETVQTILLGKISELKNLKNACLAFTGSDGRAEKLSPFSSPLELMFLAPNVKEVDETTLQKILAVAAKNPALFHSDVEVKCIETDSLICYNRNQDWKNQNKDDRPFPTRALDATFLLGDSSIFKQYKNKFYEEVESPSSKKKLDSFKTSAIRPAMQLLQRSDKGLATSDIDVNKGTMTFNGDRIKATKQSLLRPVQYKVAVHICKLIKEKKLSKDDLDKMPISIIDRIQWLAEKKLLNVSQEQVTKVQKAYTASLIWAGIAQKNFEVNGEETTTVSIHDLKDTTKAIADFCTDASIFT